jgi:hypothetical protein
LQGNAQAAVEDLLDRDADAGAERGQVKQDALHGESPQEMRPQVFPAFPAWQGEGRAAFRAWNGLPMTRRIN